MQAYDAKIEAWYLRVGHLESKLLTIPVQPGDRLAIHVELEDIAFQAEALAEEIAMKAGELAPTAPVVDAVAALKSIVRRAQRKNHTQSE